MKRGHSIPVVKLHNSPECRPSSFICRRRIPNTSTRFPSTAKTSARVVHDDCRRPRTVDDIDIRRESSLLGARRSENRTIAHPLRQLTQAMPAPGSLAPTAPLPPARPTRTCVKASSSSFSFSRVHKATEAPTENADESANALLNHCPVFTVRLG